MQKKITLEQVTSHLEDFVGRYSKRTIDHQEFHRHVRFAFSELNDIDESELTVSDGVWIAKKLEHVIKLEILLRLRTVYNLKGPLEQAFKKFSSMNGYAST